MEWMIQGYESFINDKSDNFPEPPAAKKRPNHTVPSVVFSHQDGDPMEHIEDFEPVFIHSDGQFKSVFVETVQGLEALINTQRVR
ncbi:hypothetical protein GCK72_003103 [Caenorhabditis remanei]|uniref:Uncharacterized protein n=1 Tax=Caenorhabditis remanei TaxID=31234 RepID=A0A6A5HXM3_CAERE|nr:hypothetical protein GCK72_003103 [Caenorhabditis remanei]KAF1771277.1 hypothetical protein GCK72_003103 [Caenorhabditis remanei]